MTPSRRSIPSLSLLAAVALAGCSVPSDGTLVESSFADDAAASGMTWSTLEGEPAFGWETEARGLIEAPAEVLVFVGQDLSFDVHAVDPALGRIAAGALPDAAIFEEVDAGGSLHWKPLMEDVGHHDLVFLLLDADEGDLVLAQTVVGVHVVPTSKLIEYGF